MSAGYTDVIIFLVAGAGFVAISLFLSSLLRPHNPYPEKLSMYECGVEPVGEGQVRFHARFYVFALLFVIFDVETVFLYPWAVTFKALGLPALIAMLFFLAVLTLGLLYEWRKKVLKWV